jgi:hypothetical protein
MTEGSGEPEGMVGVVISPIFLNVAMFRKISVKLPHTGVAAENGVF